jgi:hypothetical protein
MERFACAVLRQPLSAMLVFKTGAQFSAKTTVKVLENLVF